MDSCFISVKNGKKQNGMIELVVDFSTERSMPVERGKLLFTMQDRFELIVDSMVVMPALCQPINTGSANRYTYLLAFEYQGAISGKVLRVRPNEIVRQIVDYKL